MSLACRKCGAPTSAPRAFDDCERTVRIRRCKRCGHEEMSVEVFMVTITNTLEHIASTQNNIDMVNKL